MDSISSERLAVKTADSPTFIYVTHAWKRDVLRAVKLQTNSRLWRPLVLLDELVADNFDGHWQLSCGDPALIFALKYAGAISIAQANQKMLQRRLKLRVLPIVAAKLRREIALAERVIEIFQRVIELNKGDGH